MFSRTFVKNFRNIRLGLGLRNMHTCHRRNIHRHKGIPQPLFNYFSKRTFWGQTPPPDFDVDMDYYKILGVSKTASQADIKKKYFEYVKAMHPDRNPNADQDKFKELTSAYNLLSNEKKRKQYDEYRDLSGYGNSKSRSSSYGSTQNPYGDGFNPFGKGGHYNQQHGNNRQDNRYQYKSTAKTPEEMRKEFEEFFKKAANAFRQNQGQNRGNSQNNHGYNQYSQKFWEQYEKQRQQQQQYQQNSQKQYGDPREQFNQKFRQHGVPPAGVMIMRFMRNFLIIYFALYFIKAIFLNPHRARRESLEDMYHHQIMQDSYEKNVKNAMQASTYNQAQVYPKERAPPGGLPQRSQQPISEYPPRNAAFNYQRNQGQRFYNPHEDPRNR
ncbi:unnamed protein product [Moneuplotes crassus]|uniref:J domain-containing protein n=1 Tax=Euplotes crassus TaxID=5936 RepID=A0AAD1XAH5_EUPCR|nr:unnamed protein product [Moneuplotes crassus]